MRQGGTPWRLPQTPLVAGANAKESSIEGALGTPRKCQCPPPPPPARARAFGAATARRGLQLSETTYEAAEVAPACPRPLIALMVNVYCAHGQARPSGRAPRGTRVAAKHRLGSTHTVRAVRGRREGEGRGRGGTLTGLVADMPVMVAGEEMTPALVTVLVPV